MAMAVDLSQYLNMVTSPRSSGSRLQEIHYNSPSQVQVMLNSESDPEFCTKANTDECIRYMDKEFQVLGYQTLYNSHGSFDLTKLINAAHKMLRKYQQSSRNREELEIRVHRSSSDLEHSQSMLKKSRQSNKSLQNTVAKYEETERQLRIENSNLQLKLKNQHDEMKKLKGLMLSTENQLKHELKKKERHMMSIQERAQQLLTDKSKPSHAPSLEISRGLTRSDGRRSKWRNESSSNRNEEDMHNIVMSNFERRCTALQTENNRLRELLADTQHELTELTSSNHNASHKSSLKDQLQLPIDMIHERLSESLQKACSQLRANIEQGAESNSTFTANTDSRNESLNAESSPRKQNAAAEAFEVQMGNENLNASVSILEEQENLSKEKILFYKKKAKFEQEKQHLTEAALNLQKERKKLDEFKRMCLTSMNGAINQPASSSTSPNKSPGRTNDHRISQHFEQIKLAVEQSSKDNSKP